ncbi:MAG TPA: tyrosine-type recombinase/integrase [Acidobacteriaceae bacterium]|jgi:integrase|nr:tyrosine-type recombinase/integrase [Acidobacteriaceae bacterium]
MFYLTKKETRALFEVAHRHYPKYHLAMLCTLMHGMRTSEVTSLLGTDITADGQIIIRRLKGSRTTIQPVRKDSDPLFDESPLIALARERKSFRLFEVTPRHLNRLMRLYGAEAGIHPDKCHMHAWKHTTAMTIWDATGSLGQLQSYLGHVSPSSSLVYLAEADSRKAQAALAAVQF